MEKEFQRVEISPKVYPQSDNIDRDRETLISILDDLDLKIEPSVIISEYSDKITEWITWRLGIATESLASESDHEKIFYIGVTSILAADYGGWTERQGANRNSFATWLVQSGDYKTARSLCLQAISIVEPYFESVYACSHSILAAIETENKNYLKATYHLDSLFRILKNQGVDEKFKTFAKSAASTYAKAQDIAGYYFTKSLIDKNATLEHWEKIYPDYLSKINIEQKMNLYTKFISYDLNEFAKPIINYIV
jgi:hypothetical protein